jgi:zinc/manganese transport system permease protein
MAPRKDPDETARRERGRSDWLALTMFSNYMANAWISGTIVAALAGAVGFFVVLRGASFPAHAIPNGAFAGAAGATLVGVNPLFGLVSFAVLAALGIGATSRRTRNDVATALSLVLMLALGAAFLTLSSVYEPAINALLFGEILGVSASEILPVFALGVLCLAALVLLFRPLVFTSVAPELAEARGLNATLIETIFLVVLALSTALTVPVVGALLTFSLMIGPPAAARLLSSRPGRAIALSVALALVTVWLSIAGSYTFNLPIGFFVGSIGAVLFLGARLWGARFARPQQRVVA